MLKANLERFISKYNLAGACEIVKFEVNDNILSVTCLTDKHHAVVNISTTLVDLPNGEYTIIETAQLRALLGVLHDEIAISVNKINNIPVSLTMTDGKTKMFFALGDPIMLPKQPMFSVGESILGFNIDKDFISIFVKAASALPDAEIFAVTATKSELNVVLGYSETYNTNQVVINVAPTLSEDSEPWFYNTKTFREILMANREAERGSVLIDASGLAEVSFEISEFKTTYYLAPSDNS